MNKDEAEVFGRIFSDAQVVDVDMSDHFRFIGLAVVADHYRPWTEYGERTAPILLVRFEAVRVWNMTYSVHPEPTYDGPVQWLIDEAQIEWGRSAELSIRLTGLPGDPSLQVVCAAVSWTELHPRALRLDPRGVCLLRPGLEPRRE